MKLVGKIIIDGVIETLTGLHIGGSKTALEIGGVDLNIIKSPNGVPFIPGSSLKGKLRSLLAREAGSGDVATDDVRIKEVFGFSDKKTPFVTRLLVRDAALDTGHFRQAFADGKMEFEYSDVKWENQIKRETGTAQHPRQLERVPAGARFRFQMVYDVYDSFDASTSLQRHLDSIALAMKLLQDDYLGGQGSRGYGQVAFQELSVTHKILKDNQYQVAEAPLSPEVTAFSQQIAQLRAYGSRSA